MFELYVEIIKNPSKFNGTSEGTTFYKFQLEAFPQLWSSVLHCEGVIHSEIKDHNIRSLPAKKPYHQVRDQVLKWPNEKKTKVFELHAFMLYMASIEIDLGDWDAVFTLMPPSAFVPSPAKGRVAYPMNAFWKWLRHECGCTTWKQLAEKIQTSEQSVKKHANTKSLKGTPSWSEFWRMMNNAQTINDRSSPFIFKTSLAYGIARIMQEHAHRCVDIVIEHFCEPCEIGNYYLACIKDMKQNECRRIPLHPSFTDRSTS
ncbi:MAG: hypothetical protein P8R37_07755 [Opitutae bacterium]|nr:hypothetical protein [Opitutae bacterium]